MIILTNQKRIQVILNSKRKGIEEMLIKLLEVMFAQLKIVTGCMEPNHLLFNM